MALLDILDIGDLFLSGRLYLGIGMTAAMCWAIFESVPNQTVAACFAVPLGIAGLLLSFRWQVRADDKG